MSLGLFPPARSGQPAIQRLLVAVEQFLRVESASAVLLLIATAAALSWANAATHSYFEFWHTPLTLGPGAHLRAQPLRFWINEGLMTLFFLLVGLEIRAELYDGVLAQARFAILPIVAALGGILVPALIFMSVNTDPSLRRGWAVPISTDIAFSAGALALVGKRVPRPLRVLLLTLAIVDDIAAVLVIATVYSSGIAWQGLLIAACGVAAVFALRMSGIRRAFAYVLPGFVVWVGLLYSGIHPTLAGVLLGILTPVRAAPESDGEPARSSAEPMRGGESPARHLQDALHPWVAHLVMPLFALANAGIEVRGLGDSAVHYSRLATAVVLGLVVGKPAGIVLTALVCVRSGLAALAPGVHWRHIVLLGCLGGVGFTMSIFIADLAFPAGDALVITKSAVLLASATAAVSGIVFGTVALPQPAPSGGR
jgi:Na+:H+ antiporter, NhaA family